MYGSTVDRALAVATIFLPALVLATLAVLARRSMRLTLRTLSLAGLIALLAGLAFYDVITHFGSSSPYGLGNAGYPRAFLAAGLLLVTARWLLIGALAFAVWDAASRHLRGWAAGLAATLFVGIALFAAFFGLPVIDLFGSLFAFSLNGFDGHMRTAGQERLFHIVVELLMALAYLPALFYASRSGGSVSEEALAPTIPDR